MVSDGLQFSVSFEIVESIEVGTHRKRSRVISHSVKSILGDSIDSLCGRIVEIAVSLHVPQLGVICRSSPCKIFEQGEIGTQWDSVSCTVISISEE